MGCEIVFPRIEVPVFERAGPSARHFPVPRNLLMVKTGDRMACSSYDQRRRIRAGEIYICCQDLDIDSVALGRVGSASIVLDTCHDIAHHYNGGSVVVVFPCSMNKKSWNFISPWRTHHASYNSATPVIDRQGHTHETSSIADDRAWAVGGLKRED